MQLRIQSTKTKTKRKQNSFREYMSNDKILMRQIYQNFIAFEF